MKLNYTDYDRVRCLTFKRARICFWNHTYICFKSAWLFKSLSSNCILLLQLTWAIRLRRQTQKRPSSLAHTLSHTWILLGFFLYRTRNYITFFESVKSWFQLIRAKFSSCFILNNMELQCSPHQHSCPALGMSLMRWLAAIAHICLPHSFIPAVPQDKEHTSLFFHSITLSMCPRSNEVPH